MFAAPSSLPGQTWAEAGPSHAHTDAIQRTQQPIVTGTSVLGVKFDGGVILAADTLASYGSLARFDDVQRLHPVGPHTCIAAGGDMSDFQQLQHMLDGLMREERLQDDGSTLTTAQIYEWLSRVMYGRRSKFDPLWNSLLVAGIENDQPFLGYVDLLGTTYSSPTLATGYGAYIAQPLLRKAYEDKHAAGQKLTKDDAEALLRKCMKVLFYRDARSLNKYQFAVITKEGVEISKPMSSDTEWAFAERLRGYGAQVE
ncbi:uncharacterized protein L969DRAFT_58091 [Mixia osmundae IAM 14324]|uniref:Proteasome subunit beta n=1 Tax=Mixia osmundae (strain CBS 9802 / IAM 14324 / JCM 22182 / KY 12970) TaxID=764103 RepID=G7DXJ0_MIXOS|nr:uncharacterized protein L969DRAFT_58091 [Mixia osmundae IAM 14324]KEI41206.1 hypothetical protein L969DRAFT_58091 [Mixia osmundae IAM 14324]GAA95300.1 hypothetical protein E5Q_01957 [Mixia osmundae IAM 14324]